MPGADSEKLMFPSGKSRQIIKLMFKGGLTVYNAAKRLAISQGHIFGLLVEMEKGGLVTSAYDSAGARKKKVYSLAPAGLSAYYAGEFLEILKGDDASNPDKAFKFFCESIPEIRSLPFLQSKLMQDVLEKYHKMAYCFIVKRTPRIEVRDDHSGYLVFDLGDGTLMQYFLSSILSGGPPNDPFYVESQAIMQSHPEEVAKYIETMIDRYEKAAGVLKVFLQRLKGSNPSSKH